MKYFLSFLGLGLLGAVIFVVLTGRFDQSSTTEKEEIVADETIVGDDTAEVQLLRFMSILPATQVDGAPMWLFAVEDTQGRVVLSSERNQSLQIGILEDENVGGVEWQTVASSEDVGENISDHWHVFAHGYHWLSFSTQSADKGYLLQLDEDFNRVRLMNVTDSMTGVVGTMPTNDQFMVETADGVAIGYFYPGYGHYVAEVDLNGAVTDTFTIGGGEYAHGNGASAIYVEDHGYMVLAGTTLNYLAYSRLLALGFDENWDPIELNVTTLVDESTTNFSMTHGVVIGTTGDDEDIVVVARRVEDVYPAGEMPPPVSGGKLSDDGGSIVRFVFDGKTGEELSREVLYEGNSAHRPHVAYIDGRLYTMWDENNQGMLQMDEVEF